MDQRLKLQALLESLLGSRNVYFQPPANTRMQYPAMVYELDDVDNTYANNAPYRRSKRYQVTVIDRNPDSAIPDKIGLLPLSSFTRNFVNDGLYHNVFNLYF